MREARILGPLVAVVITAASAYVIYRISADIDLGEISAAMSSTPWSIIGLSATLTILSFAAIALYDIVAAYRVAPARVPAKLAGFAGVASHAIASVVGSDVLIGGPVRYRIYAVAGLDAADVARILAINLVTFWVGLTAAIGIAMAFDPGGARSFGELGTTGELIVGIALTGTVAAFVIWLWRGEREVPLMGWRLPLPHGLNGLLQVSAGAIDIAAAAAALYVLLPADVLPGFAAFLVLFVTAFTLGTVSHVPAGLGVLEATILVGLGAANQPDVVAGLLVFRVIYFGGPFVLSCAAFVLFEAWRARRN